jgi:hypothetical protein
MHLDWHNAGRHLTALQLTRSCMHDMTSSMQDTQRSTRPPSLSQCHPRMQCSRHHWVSDRRVHTPPSCFQTLDACQHAVCLDVSPARTRTCDHRQSTKRKSTCMACTAWNNRPRAHSLLRMPALRPALSHSGDGVFLVHSSKLHQARNNNCIQT